ncbi:TRAP transporter small permease [bacterium]|nr:TRAP transporter small permease [bacterium]
MKLILALDRKLARCETWLLVLIVCFMVVAAFTQVILRNFFNFAITGTDIFLRHLVLWIGFIGASLATHSEKHIVIDVLSRVSGPRLKKVTRIAVLLFAAGITGVLCRAAFVFVRSEYDYGTTLFGSMPAWTLELIIPLGFLMIGLRFLLHTLTTLFPPSESLNT